LNDKLVRLKEWVEQELGYGYGGDPWVTNVVEEEKWAAEEETYRKVLEKIDDLLQEP